MNYSRLRLTGEIIMKFIGIGFALLILLSAVSGCASNKAEKEAYFNDGKMDQQVENWKKPGGRH